MGPAATPAPLVVTVDVTDTVATAWRAGIQRTVCQLVDHLSRDGRLELVPVCWSDSIQGFRRLTPAEMARLDPLTAPPPAPPPPQAPPGRRERFLAATRPRLGTLRRWLAGWLARTPLDPLLRDLRRWVRRHGRDRGHVELAWHPPTGSVLLELDTVWNNTLVDRAELYRGLRAQGVLIAALVYDLLPQTNPDWFEASMVAVSDRTLAAQRGADVVFAISQHTASELRRWSGALDGAAPDALPEPVVVELGADVASDGTPTDAERADAPLPSELVGQRYLLVVGTVEPRKNHRLLIEVMQRLWVRHPEVWLVVVGRPGWRNDEVVRRLEGLEADGLQVRWLRACGDAQLATLYRHAHVVVVPSLTEGYGLPVIEALTRGVPVVASDGGALPEAGSGVVDHVPADDVEQWVTVLSAHLDDEELHRRRRTAAQSFRPPTWQATADQVAATLLERTPPRGSR